MEQQIEVARMNALSYLIQAMDQRSDRGEAYNQIREFIADTLLFKNMTGEVQQREDKRNRTDMDILNKLNQFSKVSEEDSGR